MRNNTETQSEWPSLRFPNGSVVCNSLIISEARFDIDIIHRSCSHSLVFMHLGMCIYVFMSVQFYHVKTHVTSTAKIHSSFLIRTPMQLFYGHGYPHCMHVFKGSGRLVRVGRPTPGAGIE